MKIHVLIKKVFDLASRKHLLDLAVAVNVKHLGDICRIQPTVVDEASHVKEPFTNGEFDARHGHIFVDGCETRTPNPNYWLGQDKCVLVDLSWERNKQ